MTGKTTIEGEQHQSSDSIGSFVHDARCNKEASANIVSFVFINDNTVLIKPPRRSEGF